MTDAPIQIRNPETVRVIRRFADLLGKPITEAVKIATEEALTRRAQADQGGYERRLAALEEISRRAAALPIVGPKLMDEDLYDEEGLPK